VLLPLPKAVDRQGSPLYTVADHAIGAAGPKGWGRGGRGRWGQGGDGRRR
jgi:hypothetical protein